ncbi:MAG: type IV pilus modification protein PilV [Ketobacter sp.]|nr:MAG: type IV pilus modification protein PilV [Ketobacter sp.]
MSVILSKSKKSQGFTLIEVLVAALVLGIGILGMATMMLTSLKSDQSAFYRSLASSYAYDMADRIRKNSARALANNSYDAIDTSGTIPSAPTCFGNATGCSPAERVSLDIREWAGNFVNVNSVANFHPSLPNAVGTITRGENNLFTITITWSETDWDATDTSQKVAADQTLSMNILL